MFKLGQTEDKIQAGMLGQLNGSGGETIPAAQPAASAASPFLTASNPANNVFGFSDQVAREGLARQDADSKSAAISDIYKTSIELYKAGKIREAVAKMAEANPEILSTQLAKDLEVDQTVAKKMGEAEAPINQFNVLPDGSVVQLSGGPGKGKATRLLGPIVGNGKDSAGWKKYEEGLGTEFSKFDGPNATANIKRLEDAAALLDSDKVKTGPGYDLLGKVPILGETAQVLYSPEAVEAKQLIERVGVEGISAVLPGAISNFEQIAYLKRIYNDQFAPEVNKKNLKDFISQLKEIANNKAEAKEHFLANKGNMTGFKGKVYESISDYPPLVRDVLEEGQKLRVADEDKKIADSGLGAKDQAALKFARENPDNPNTPKIMERLNLLMQQKQPRKDAN